MQNMQKIRDSFLENFNERFPHCEILQFTNITEPFRVKAQDGTIYFFNKACNTNKIKKLPDAAIEDKISYFQSKLDSIFGNIKLLCYNGKKEKILVEDENGFTYSPQAYDLLVGHPPSIQTCNEKEKLFIFKANLVHGNKYVYPQFVYYNGKQKIDIICPTHGIFKQKIEAHLIGNGCKKCANDLSTFSNKKWADKFKHKICTLYLIELYNEYERFVKIGITANGVKYRFSNLKNYNYKVIIEIKGSSHYIAELESSILKNYKKFKYKEANIDVGGNTETFKIEIKDKIYADLLLLGHPPKT